MEKKLFSHGRKDKMVSVERMYIFPLPSWNNPIIGGGIGKLRCLCCQFDIDEHGYGPYGFSTERAREIIREVFGRLHYWDPITKDLTAKDIPTKSGVYFYRNTDFIDTNQGELKKNKLVQKKNALLEKRGMQTLPIGELPILLKLYDKDEQVSGKTLDSILQKCDTLFIRHFYSPEAGEVLILFNDHIINYVEATAKQRGVELQHIDTINMLQPW